MRRVLELRVERRVCLGRLHLEPLGQLGRGLVDHVRLDLGAGLHQPLRDPDGGRCRRPRSGRGSGTSRARSSRARCRRCPARPPRRGSAPRASSAATTSPCPHHAAWCSGVPPICPGRSIGTPSSSRISTAARRPSAAAWCSASANSVRMPLDAVGVRGRQPQRAVAVAGEAEADQLVDRADLAARAELGEHLAEVRPPHPPREPVRACARSARPRRCTSAPAATSIRITSGERPR